MRDAGNALARAGVAKAGPWPRPGPGLEPGLGLGPGLAGPGWAGGWGPGAGGREPGAKSRGPGTGGRGPGAGVRGQGPRAGPPEPQTASSLLFNN